MFDLFFKIFKLINSDVSPNQIAFGLCFGIIIGLTPLISVHNALLLFLVCFLRINLGAALFSVMIFSLFAYLLDPVFNELGLMILTNPELKPLWTSLYQQDFWLLLKFNNTLTMGSFVVAIALQLPCFFLFRFLIIRYRVQFLEWVKKTRLGQMLMTSKIFMAAHSLYAKVS